MPNQFSTDDAARLDKWDYIVAASSGVITALVDVLWIKDISLSKAHTWGKEKTDDFVFKVAQSQGYKGKELPGAVKYLEDLYPISADKLTNDFGGGKQHHLRDFSHHPTVVGLIFSILTQFTGTGYGTDVDGNFRITPLPKESVVNGGVLEKIYSGTVTWAFHMISDIAGSSSSVTMNKEGTGLPGPLMSFLKELSSVPGIKSLLGKDEKEHHQFSVACSKLFNGTLLGVHDESGNIVKGGELEFDLRTEMGITHEMVAKGQYLPVIINDLVVRAFYAVRRFIGEAKRLNIQTIEDVRLISPSAFLPWNSNQLSHMLVISSASFSVIDITAAGIKAAVKNKDNKSGFALDFIQGINYIGVGKLGMAINSEACIGIEMLQTKFLGLVDEQLVRFGLTHEEVGERVTGTVNKIGTIAGVVTPVGFVSAAVAVYREISDSLAEYNIAKEERIAIEQLCSRNVTTILENREQMELAVSQYMELNLIVFSDAFEAMNQAILDNDSDAFISGNNKIQSQLGKADSFKSQSEFDTLMQADEDFKL